MRIDELNCKQRVAWIDCLKTLAIFLVLWGHCIQLLQNGEMHWNNDVYSFIYGFHMPLFMAISGFFSKNLLKLDITSLLRKKGIQFLFPVIVWGSLAWGLDTFGARTSGMSIQYAIVFRYLWFLKSIFICVCLFYFAFKICKGLGGVLLALILSQAISYFQVRYMFPCFLCGYLLSIKFDILKRYSLYIAIITAIVYIYMFQYWGKVYHDPVFSINELIYNLKSNNLIETWDILCLGYFKLIFGLLGATSCFFLLYWISNLFDNKFLNNSIPKLGTQTLGIYILQTILLESLMPHLIYFEYKDIWIYNFVLFPIISLFVLYVCGYLSIFITQNRYLFWIINPNLKIREDVGRSKVFRKL